MKKQARSVRNAFRPSPLISSGDMYPDIKGGKNPGCWKSKQNLNQ